MYVYSFCCSRCITYSVFEHPKSNKLCTCFMSYSISLFDLK